MAWIAASSGVLQRLDGVCEDISGIEFTVEPSRYDGRFDIAAALRPRVYGYFDKNGGLPIASECYIYIDAGQGAYYRAKVTLGVDYSRPGKYAFWAIEAMTYTRSEQTS